MTYLMFFLSIGLLTVLALVIKRFQQQRRQYVIAQQKLKEADKKLDHAERIYEELVRQSDNQINVLQNQLKNLQQQLKQVEHELSCRISATGKLQELAEEKEQARKDANDLYKDIEKEIVERTKELENKIKELEDINDGLRRENQNLKSVKPLEKNEVIVLKVTEKDLYPREKIEMLIDVLKNSLINVRDNSRRQHIISDIISNNRFNSRRKEIRTEIHSLFRGYKSMNSSTRNTFERMGFQIVSENNNYKAIFHGDRRYTVVLAKTPSDWRAGRNIASDICNLLL